MYRSLHVIVPQQFGRPRAVELEHSRGLLDLIAEFGFIVFLLADVSVSQGAVLSSEHVVVPRGVVHEGEAPAFAHDAGGVGSFHRLGGVRPDPEQAWVQTARPEVLACGVT